MMDLKVAQEHSKRLNSLREELNAAIAHAALDNVHVELEIFQVTTIGNRYYETVNIAVKVDPDDIEV